MNTALEAFGRVDVMICNAGIALPRPIHEAAPEEWDRMMGVSVKAIYSSRTPRGPGDEEAWRGPVPPHRIDLLGLRHGAAGGLRPFQGGCDPDRADDGRRLRPGQHPGECRLPGRRGDSAAPQDRHRVGRSEKFLGNLAAASPIGRDAQPEEIARFFQFLASDHARFFTGSVLMIDGGYSAR